MDRVPNDEESVRRLIGRLGDPRLLAVCYEAGPSGYELHRLLSSMGVACEVIAPSLVPKGASDRVKTDRRDAVRLTLALRAGMLTPVRVPSPSEEAVRDLVRARGDLLDDRRRAQQRLSAFLLRHGRVWGGTKWTCAHRAWVDRQEFAEAAMQETLDAYRGALEAREAELRAAEARLGAWAGREPLAGGRAAGAYRGIAELTALTLATKVVDWRRFATARAFMGFTGLVPPSTPAGPGPGAARSPRPAPKGSGPRWWSPRGPTGTGPRSARCCAAARPGGPGTLARSWKAQQRLHATWRKMAARGKPPSITATAVARELAGFVWAEMTS